MATFVLKFTRFRCHGNKRTMSAKFACHLQAGRPPNTLLDASILVVGLCLT